jgi:hypothetical protein
MLFLFFYKDEMNFFISIAIVLKSFEFTFLAWQTPIFQKIDNCISA